MSFDSRNDASFFCCSTENPTHRILDVPSVMVPSKYIEFFPFFTGDKDVSAAWTLAFGSGSSRDSNDSISRKRHLRVEGVAIGEMLLTGLEAVVGLEMAGY